MKHTEIIEKKIRMQTLSGTGTERAEGCGGLEKIHWLPVWIIGMAFAGCLGPVHEIYSEDEALRPVSVYVVSHGWHVGIAFESVYFRGKIPHHEKFPTSRYLKFGWGDAAYYPHKDPGLGLLLRAALIPTPSVLHVVGIETDLADYFPASALVRVKISAEGMEKLADFIAEKFRKSRKGKLMYAEEGLYANSAFFEAKGYYYLPETSNRWTAQALRQTGAPVSPFYAITSGNVIRQSRQIGEQLQ